MAQVSTEFMMGLENECLTVIAPPGKSEDVPAGLNALFGALSTKIPCLPGPTGLFTPYGRVYVDVNNHVEVATAECDSPYALATMVEQLQQLLRQTIHSDCRREPRLILANNNYSGPLQPGAPTWGAHENYLVEKPPEVFADAILPFLVTRVYAGAGGLVSPQGVFLAGVRTLFLQADVGGETTRQRAIHSTARSEHHLGRHDRRYRYHLVLGDGHRSQFSLALQFGATALALKAIFFTPGLVERLPGMTGSPRRVFWLTALRQLQRLARPGKPPQVHPLAIRVQRLYLDGARRYAEAVRDLPDWVPRLLQDWETTLQALAQDDRPWLAARLDPWIKYELYTATLQAMGHTWQDLLHKPDLFLQLSLLDQDYHEFTNPASVFDRLEQSGALLHRVAAPLAPGGEQEPFVPETTTRARARARFLRTHAGQPGLVMNWAEVSRPRDKHRRKLEDPFGQEYGPWEPADHS